MKKNMRDLYSDFYGDIEKEMNGILNKTIQKNTNDALKLQDEILQMDGIQLPPIDTPQPLTYQDVTDIVKKSVVGLEIAIDSLNTAYKRPFFQEDHPIRNTILIAGPKGSGKHNLLKNFQDALYSKGVLKHRDIITINLEKIKDEKTLLLDLYDALQKSDTTICFEGLLTCDQSYLSIISELCDKGEITLKNRYAKQNNVVMSVDNFLDTNLVKSLKANHHYLVFIVDGNKGKLPNQFLALMHDVIETQYLSKNDCLSLIGKDIMLLASDIQNHFQTKLHFDESYVTYLYSQYATGEGYHGILKTILKTKQALESLLLTTKETEVTLTFSTTVEANGQALFKASDLSKELEDIEAQLDDIVGLSNVKDYVHSLKDMVQMRQRRLSQGLKAADISMHMIFTGNPGTGKTTMARLMAKYLKALGILKNGQLVEVTRADLVGQYLGQTAPKTKERIEQALGGILFIDEAYALYRGENDSYGLEAIDMLVKMMEDHRDDFIVVLAGYTKEMNDFLQANSGLKSRFPNQIEFPDYTGEELLKIAISQAKSRDYTIDEGFLPTLQIHFNTVQLNHAKDSGNGRYARNVVEDAILHQASRVSKDPDSDLSLLIGDDFKLKTE